VTATSQLRSGLSFVFKLVLLLVGLLVAALLGLVIYLYISSRHTITLPAPTGPYAVGRASFDWIDQGRTDPVAPSLGIKRELMVWVWYPAVPGSAPPAPYLPEPLQSADRNLFLNGAITRLLIHDPAKVRSHSLGGATIAGNHARYPVVLIKSGFGALALNYSAIAEDLASRGYVVVGTDAPYSAGVVAFPDGRIITRSPAGSPSITGPRQAFDRLVAIWTADSSLVLDKLKELNETPGNALAGHLDLSSVGVVGHSFGGASAAQFCARDPRCKAGIDLDGQLFGSFSTTPIRVPFMFLLTEHSGEDQQLIMSKIRHVYQGLPAGRVAVSINGARHFNVSDMAFLRNPAFLSRAIGAIGTLDRRRALKVAEDWVATFFDVHLKGRNSKVLELPSPAYPEVRQLDL
jgi:predicted dienelactone hydrolase